MGLKAQVANEHISNKAIYLFLDELSVDGIIQLNKIAKPYSRKLIAEKLQEARQHSELLNPRQKKELDFYWKSFKIDLPIMMEAKHDVLDLLPGKEWATSINPLSGIYKDSMATFSIKPILGYQVWSNENGNISHRWSGVDTYGYFGKNFAFYASMRDNIESQRISSPEYLTQRVGVPVKNNYDGEQGQVAYTEMRGGLTYEWNWGDVGLVKDHVEWGTNYNGSNIFSGHSPSFAMVKLNLHPTRWFEFNFFHGWLASAEVDSARTYYGNSSTIRTVYHEKNIAANMVSLIPWGHTRFSFGNSIVYSDMGTHPAYLNPFMFYKSIDHTYQSSGDKIDNDAGQNAQMFLEASTKALKHFHFYATLFIDEISMSKIGDPDLNTNLLSYKLGVKTYNLLPNVSAVFEFTKNRPMCYEHYIRTTTFASSKYNLGHYLRENARDVYAELAWKPMRGLHLTASYNLAQKGPELMNDANQNKGLPFMETVEWERTEWKLAAQYEVINNAYVFMHYSLSDLEGNQKYNSSYYNGTTHTFSLGITNNF